VITWGLEFFKNNLAAEYLKAYGRANPNMGNLVNGDTPNIRVE